MVNRVLKRWTILPGLICVMASAGASEARGLEPQGEYTYAETGPFSFQSVESLTLADRQRGTDVLVRIYYPNGDGPFPVIVFSHSVGGNKDLFGAISMHWASHGYVAVHPTHDDSGVRMGPDGMQPPPEKVRGRVRDVTAVLDALEQIEVQIPDLQGKLDRTRLAVAGHSYGSFTTMASGGVTVDLGPESNVNLGRSPDPVYSAHLTVGPRRLRHERHQLGESDNRGALYHRDSRSKGGAARDLAHGTL